MPWDFYQTMCGVGGSRFSACPTSSLGLSPVTSPRGVAITLGKNLLNVEYLRSFLKEQNQIQPTILTRIPHNHPFNKS